MKQTLQFLVLWCFYPWWEGTHLIQNIHVDLMDPGVLSAGMRDKQEKEIESGGGCKLHKAAGTSFSYRWSDYALLVSPGHRSVTKCNEPVLTGRCSKALASVFFMVLPSRGRRSIFPVWAKSKWVPGGRGSTAGGTEGPW